MQEVFFVNSGCEANEAAIKLARLYGHHRGIENPAIIVMEKAFHGRTLATLSATGNRKVQAGFEPLVKGFVRVPYDDIESIRQVAQNNANVVAILVEPVQGEGGIRTPEIAYLQQLRQLCNEHNWLLMLDEVQTGIGRTGRWFAHQHANILPDVMTLAKGLGSGVPVSACLAAGAATSTFKPGNHGSTFGGNPLACVAGLTTLNIVEQDQLLAHAERLGQFIRQGFTAAQLRLTRIGGVLRVQPKACLIRCESHPVAIWTIAPWIKECPPWAEATIQFHERTDIRKVIGSCHSTPSRCPSLELPQQTGEGVPLFGSRA
jgi:acetylornithine aminotransferase